MSAGPIMQECKASLAALKLRIKKYQTAMDELSAGRISIEKLKKKDVKLDAADKRCMKAKAALDKFLSGAFKAELAEAPEDLQALMEKWEKKAQKLSFDMRQELALHMYLTPPENFETDFGL